MKIWGYHEQTFSLVIGYWKMWTSIQVNNPCHRSYPVIIVQHLCVDDYLYCDITAILIFVWDRYHPTFCPCSKYCQWERGSGRAFRVVWQCPRYHAQILIFKASLSVLGFSPFVSPPQGENVHPRRKFSPRGSITLSCFFRRGTVPFETASTF